MYKSSKTKEQQSIYTFCVTCMVQKIQVFVTCIYIIVGLALGQTCKYYVATSGSDSNNGMTPSSPWATTAKVNSVKLQAGDVVCFYAGNIFDGGIVFGANNTGNAANPIIFTSYASAGQSATIKSRNGESGFMIHNTAGVEIRNIIFIGQGASTIPQYAGVYLFADILSGTKFDHVVLENIELSGFEMGVKIQAYQFPPQKVYIIININANLFIQNYCGFKNILILNVIAHDNLECGICASGVHEHPPTSQMSHQNITIRNALVYNNKGNMA